MAPCRDTGDAEKRSDGNPIIPAQSATLAPILALLNAVVSKITIAKTGQLAVAFEQDRMMFVPPDAAYEAWQLECSTENGDSRLVCPPGGDVAFFDDAIMPQRAGSSFELSSRGLGWQ